MLHIKKTRAKGKTYWYFRTGKLDARGKEILARLPGPKDPGFGNSYASFMAARKARENQAAELTVSGLCDLYERSEHFRRLAPGTQRLYGISLRHLRKVLPTAPAALLERKDVVRMMDDRGNQPGAANSLLRATNALYKWARVRDHVQNNPCRDVEELAVGEHQPWPDGLVDAALAAENDRVRLAVHLLLYTAQRIGDVVRLRWTDIETGPDGRKRLHLVQQKTGRRLTIPLHDRLRSELERRDGRIGYILAGVQAQPLAQSTLRKQLQAFAADHGLKVVPHGLRKNAVNALLEAGCSAAETAAISGQSLKMVEHYAKQRSQVKLGEAAILKWQDARR